MKKTCLIIALLFMTGCQFSKAEEVDKSVIYKNEEAGLKVYESEDWLLDTEVSSEPFNATFKQESAKAIVSILPGKKSLHQIKNELGLTDEFIQLIEESEYHISFQMNELKNFRSDIYIEHTNADDTLIVTFLTPVIEYEQQKEGKDLFRHNIELIH
ncbi:hypothetical protein [Bacillus solitudinis]|uniref:hypothetical protein n=1 Tax=Bacillus solitudinis TaxID=2014074 RepID=UPI000C24E118|nr:hypothetical protein [Bacillus solitudinis]